MKGKNTSEKRAHEIVLSIALNNRPGEVASAEDTIRRVNAGKMSKVLAIVGIISLFFVEHNQALIAAFGVACFIVSFVLMCKSCISKDTKKAYGGFEKAIPLIRKSNSHKQLLEYLEGYFVKEYSHVETDIETTFARELASEIREMKLAGDRRWRSLDRAALSIGISSCASSISLPRTAKAH